VFIKRTDKTDFYGILDIKNGNLSGISLLENAVKKDTNNIWLYVNLAKAGLMAGDIQKFQYYLNRGKQIHPCYEPLFLLEAKYLFDKGDYSESMSVLKKLFEINPRYLPAKQLFGDLKSKLNF
jgi:tetratricopeptide (TPR) repeat protein